MPIQQSLNIEIFLNIEIEYILSFSDDQILRILRALDINKAHGHDEISIRLLKLWDKSV